MSVRSLFTRTSSLTREQKRLWGVAVGVIVVGTAFKTAYFQFSRGLMVDDMTSRHLSAKAHLREAREYSRRAAEERERRAPKLTDEQRDQLRRYLALAAENDPEVHPREKGARMPMRPAKDGLVR